MLRVMQIQQLTAFLVTLIINLTWLEDIRPIIYDIVCRECPSPLC